jgi:hypothetical protein
MPAVSSKTVTLYVPRDSRLPDSDQWINRFEIRSETSNRVYIVSQNRVKRHWACSCPGYRTHRTCKHLASMSLPAYERAHEVLVK